MLSCECDFGGYGDFHWDGERKARKVHKCDECQKDIVPGEVYHYTFGKYDGDTYIEKTCEHCDDLWGILTDLGFCRMGGGVLFECLREYFDELVHYDEAIDEYVLNNGKRPYDHVDCLREKSRSQGKSDENLRTNTDGD